MATAAERFAVALGHFRAGRGGEARRVCREIAVSDGRFAPAQAMLGLLALRENDLDEAERRFALATAAAPDSVEHRVNHGLALLGQKRWQVAVEAMGRATLDFPHSASLWSILGNAHAGLHGWDRAEAAFARAAAAAPGDAAHLYNRALACDRGGRRDRAAGLYRETLRHEPRHADARNNLGLVLYDQGRLAEAAECFATVLRNGAHGGAAVNLARLMMASGRADEALALAARAAETWPDMADAHHYLGELQDAVGRREEAAAAYARAIDVDPDHRFARAALLHASRMIADFDAVERLEAGVVACALADAAAGERPALTPFMAMACTMSAADEAAIARATAAAIAPDAAAAPPLWQSHRGQRPGPGQRLRIGYLSNDFRDQATAHLAVGLFENHDRDRFEIVAFSHTGPAEDTYRRRIEAAVDRFVDITPLDHAAAARTVAETGCDILVDLKGHTRDNRLAVFAHRPAPLQVTYLGFPGTTGAPWMGAMIADPVVAPDDVAGHFSERVWRIEPCYQINDNRAVMASRPATRAEVGLPDDAMVYACFNEPWKIDRASFALWCRVLQGVPGALLWLRDGGAAATANLRREAARHGVDPARLAFAPRLAKPEHLARIALADLFLDSLVVNAHTTATDALWAGLPLLTVAGERFPSRVAASLLTAAGLRELVVADHEAYVARAIAFGTDTTLRKSARQGTSGARKSPLFDSKATTSSIEHALSQAIDRHEFTKA